MKLEISKEALDWLATFREPKRFKQVVSKILSLLKDPLPSDSEELKGYAARRATVGEYRIIYTVDEVSATVTIIVIGKRNDDEIYKQLKR